MMRSCECSIKTTAVFVAPDSNTKPKSPLLPLTLNSPNLQSLKSNHLSTTCAVPPLQTLDGLAQVSESETPVPPSPIVADAELHKVPPKPKIRIKLRSYWVPLIEDTCKQITDAARTTNANIVGPVPLPTKKRVYCVLKSPNGHKDARFHFEIRTHQRLIDIIHPTAQTIDKLMQLDLPAGVDVEVKL